jgi:glycine/D-amino acid oxidase-like deaminating enzyme
VRAVVPGGAGGTAVETGEGRLAAGRVVVAAGAWSRRLLAGAGVDLPAVATHAEILETTPQPPALTHFVAEASDARADLETAMADPAFAPRWTGPTTDTAELLPAAVQLCVAQFGDGRIRLGQVSRAVPGFLPGPLPGGEALLRERAARFLPRLADVPATLRARSVAISADKLPLAGALAQAPDVFVMTAMDSPLIFAPAIAARLATALAGEPTPDLDPFRPDRVAPPPD